MTKHAATKKAIREYAAAQGLSYTSALRALGDSSHDHAAVIATLTFRGPGAPASVQFDVSPWLHLLGETDFEWLRSDRWEYDPSIPERDYLPNFLDLATHDDGDPVLLAAAEWVRRNTTPWVEEFEVPDDSSPTGMRTTGTSGIDYPWVLQFDRKGTERWLRDHRTSEVPSSQTP